jgi:hypothetical protein
MTFGEKYRPKAIDADLEDVERNPERGWDEGSLAASTDAESDEDFLLHLHFSDGLSQEEKDAIVRRMNNESIKNCLAAKR